MRNQEQVNKQFLKEEVQIGKYMANFRERLTNFLASKIPSRTIEVQGGANQGASIIQKNQIGSVVSALRNTQAQSPQPLQQPQIPQQSQIKPTSTLNPQPQIQPITSDPQPPQTMMQGSALVQPTTPPAWRPVIGSKLPTGSEEKKKLIDAMVQKESSGQTDVIAQPKGKSKSYGQMQLEKNTWNDISAWRKKKNQKVYDFDKYWDNPLINRQYGTQYIFELIPSMLTNLKVPVTFENVMASYTPGVGEFGKGDYDVKKYPNVLRDIARVQKFYE